MKTKNIIVLIASFILISVFACQKDVVIKQLPYISKVSIQGLLTPNTYPHVYLYHTVPYFDPRTSVRSLFIDNAIVKISDGVTNDVLHIDSSYNGFRCTYEYFYSGTQLTQSNKTYNLNIDYNGETFTASTTTDRFKVTLDNVAYTPAFTDVYGEHEGIIFYFKDDASQKNYYRYEMTRIVDSSKYTASGVKSPCLGGGTAMVQEIGRTIYTDENVNGLPLVFTVEPSYTHAENDTGYVRIQSCDRNMFEFYDQLDRQKLAEYNPFVEPVFFKPYQFPNAIGVFGSYTLSDSVLFVYPE